MADAVFVKTDPDHHQNTYAMSHSGFPMPNQQHYANHYGNNNDGIDPSDLSMQANGFMPYFSPQQNLSSGFSLGNSGIGTEELLDLEVNPPNDLPHVDGMNFFPDQRQNTGMSMSHPGTVSQMYSQTPDGAPMQSPFLQNGFGYDQLRSMNQQQSQHAASHFQSPPSNLGKSQPRMQAVDHTASEARSPMASAKPAGAMGSLNLGSQESSSFPTQPIRAPTMSNRHQKKFSTQWDGTPTSAHSFVESPISSPGHMSHHAGISEVLKSGKHASLPAKVDEPPMPGSSQNMETQEAKRRRRRASHNLVERRRRDNINERIHDLSHLVPQHRLEDDKIRKQLVTNNTSVPGSSPATSLLAGGNGRRATPGNITMGLPMDEKEKGPNKGDILNGAVSWMRDLMWALHVKMQQESELADLISSLGGTWPFEQTEEEKRMRTEILDALERNDPNSFNYSRAPGSGLRVPKHTNMAGDAVSGAAAMSPQSLSPPLNGSNSSNSGGQGQGQGQGQAQYWTGSGHAGISFKEEDEYAMDTN